MPSIVEKQLPRKKGSGFDRGSEMCYNRENGSGACGQAQPRCRTEKTMKRKRQHAQ